MDPTVGEVVCVSVGAVAVGVAFAYRFLDKLHTRHIGEWPKTQPGHRHPNNERRGRRAEVKEFDTMDLSKIQRQAQTYNSYLVKVDPEQTVIIERP